MPKRRRISIRSRAYLGGIFGSCCRRLSRHSMRYFMTPLFSLANVMFESVSYRCFRRFSRGHHIDFNILFKGSFVRMVFIVIFSVYISVIVVIVAPSLKLPVFVGSRNSFQHVLWDIFI